MSAPASPDPALGAAIKRLRLRRDLTQEELAHRAGMTTAALARIERAQSNPTWATLRRIAKALDVSMGELAAAADQR